MAVRQGDWYFQVGLHYRSDALHLLLYPITHILEYKTPPYSQCICFQEQLENVGQYLTVHFWEKIFDISGLWKCLMYCHRPRLPYIPGKSLENRRNKTNVEKSWVSSAGGLTNAPVVFRFWLLQLFYSQKTVHIIYSAYANNEFSYRKPKSTGCFCTICSFSQQQISKNWCM